MARYNFGNILFFVATLLITAYGHTNHDLNNGQYKLMTHGDKATRTIEFNLEVKNHTGWIGVGVGPSASMAGADLVIAGLFSNGSAYHTDMYGKANTMPTRDNKTDSDWVLFHSNITVDGASTTTFLSFRRFLKTNDTNEGQDYEIKNEEQYVIMALGPYDEATGMPGYHTNSSTTRKFEKKNIGLEAAAGAGALNAMAVFVSLCIASAFGLKF